MKTLTINTTVIKAIRKLLNENGWRGYRKDIAMRCDVSDAGIANSPNLLMFDEDGHDLYDHRVIDEWKDEVVELVDSRAEFDVWLYRQDELMNQRSVCVYVSAHGKAHFSMHFQDALEIEVREQSNRQ